MEITRLDELKPRNIWEITDDAFDLYREHFALLASVSALVFVPVGLLSVLVTISGWGSILQLDRGPAAFTRGMGSLAAIVPTFVIGATFQAAATALAVRHILQGEPTSIAAVYKQVLRRFFALFFAGLFVSVLSFVSLCVSLGLGPLLIGACYCFVAHGVVLEDKTLVGALKRSADIARSYFGKSFGLFLLMAMVTTALVGGMLGVISLLFSFFPQAEGAAGVFEMQKIHQTADVVANSAVALLVAPLPAIATTLLYYDLRVRREGLDIEHDANKWGVPLAPDPFHGVLHPKEAKKKEGRRK